MYVLENVEATTPTRIYLDTTSDIVKRVIKMMQGAVKPGGSDSMYAPLQAV